jgi:hypothetical protein
MRLTAQLLVVLVVTGVSLAASASVEPDPSKLSPPGGDGWQTLSPGVSATATAVSATSALTRSAIPMAIGSEPQVSLAVAPVVLPGDAAPAVSTFTISPQDVNLRNALDRWLQGQGWQLAWKIDDDLPLEFNATFTGDFTSVLTQVMQATNHMRTPTRVCRHTNHVIRVIARAASCKD